jgi:hypothetical protein
MEVQKVGDITHSEFMENFYKPGIPVVFKNASKVWKARGTFTPDWFRQNYGERITELDGKQYTMKQVLDLVEASTVDNPAPYPFLFNIPKVIPEVLPMVQPLNLNYAVPNWLDNKWFSRGYWGNATEIFIGGPGGQFPYVHIDYYRLNAWVTQLYGEKQFIVFPKGQDECLYPKPDDEWQSQVNIFNPDYNKHPKYKDATPIKFVVGPGETLFIPNGTWHSAYSLTPTISVAFDQLNSKNYPKFIKDVWYFKRREGLMKAILNYGYARLAGQMSKMSEPL